MLSTFVQRHKFWTIPLLISLVCSWCMLFCQSLAQIVLAPETSAQQMTGHMIEQPKAQLESTSLPACHGADATDAQQSSSIELAASCTGCEQPAAAIEPLSLASCAILVSWLHSAVTQQLNPSERLILAQAPPRQSDQPLYLTKGVFLI